jgi:6-phosphogluconolactonase
MAYIAVGGNGRVLMGASYKQGMLSVNRIGADGTVAAPSTQVLTTPPKAHCIIQGRSRDVVYATTVDGNAILIYRLDIQRSVLALADSHSVLCRPGSGPRHLVLHPTLDVLYCVNETSGTLAAFAVDPSSGALTELQCESLVPSGFQGNARAADVHIAPSGRFIYASVRSSNVVGGFSIDSRSGRLAPVGCYAVQGSPRGFAIDPFERFLICASQTENTVGIYAIDAESGALAARHHVPVGGNPNWVETLSLPVGI